MSTIAVTRNGRRFSVEVNGQPVYSTDTKRDASTLAEALAPIEADLLRLQTLVADRVSSDERRALTVRVNEAFQAAREAL